MVPQKSNKHGASRAHSLIPAHGVVSSFGIRWLKCKESKNYSSCCFKYIFTWKLKCIKSSWHHHHHANQPPKDITRYVQSNRTPSYHKTVIWLEAYIRIRIFFEVLFEAITGTNYHERRVKGHYKLYKNSRVNGCTKIPYVSS